MKRIPIILVMFLLFIENAFADSVEHLNYDTMYDITYNDAVEALNTSKHGINMKSAYKLYQYTGYDLINNLESKTVDANISDDYSWIIIDDKKQIIKVVNSNDKWSYAGTCMPDYNYAQTDQVIFDDVNRAVNELENNNESIITLKCFEYPMYYSSFTYIKTDVDEYIIPFSYREDFTLMKNGNRYTLGAAADLLSKGFTKIDSQDDGNYNGGANIAKNVVDNSGDISAATGKSVNYAIIYMTVLCLIISLIVYRVYSLKRKRS